jgi:uncharacterized protein YndB with AHSA1/START domain
MLEGKIDITNTAGREIITSRTFDAPRDLVFSVWIEPQHVINWWGPNGFTNTIHEMDVRPGGVWRFIMHGPDGTDYNNKIIYVEILRPEKLVYDHVSGPLFRSSVKFDEHDGKTTVTMHSVFESAAELEKVVKQFNAIEGAQQHLGRLGEYLAKVSA